jgi:hypothetical protein
MLGVGIGLLAGRRATPGAYALGLGSGAYAHTPTDLTLTYTPGATLLGQSSSVVTEPTLPTHAVGNLIVVACGASSSTNPTLTSGPWTTWGGPFTASGRSITVFSLVASATNHTIAITGESGVRQAWVFGNAAIDQIGTANAASTTNCPWPSLSLTGSCLVGGFAYVNQAQTDITAILPAGMTERGNKNAASAGIAFDSDTTTLSGTYAPAAGTLDTSGSPITVLFSIKGL